jgi:hypothetical protein
MPSSHKARIAPEVFRFHIKYLVAGDSLVCRRDILLAIQDLEGNPDVLHFLVNGILPHSIVGIRVLEDTVIPSHWYFNPKLVIPLEVTLHHRGYDAVPLLQNVWSPPYKGRRILKILCNGVLCNFQWVTLLDGSETLSNCGSIFPLNTQVPANCGLL